MCVFTKTYIRKEKNKELKKEKHLHGPKPTVIKKRETLTDRNFDDFDRNFTKTDRFSRTCRQTHGICIQILVYEICSKFTGFPPDFAKFRIPPVPETEGIIGILNPGQGRSGEDVFGEGRICMMMEI